MKTRRATSTVLILLTGCLLLAAQEAAQETTAAKTQTKEETTPSIQAKPLFKYDAGGRRDPFKDLLGGRDVREVSGAGGTQTYVEDLILIGIVKDPKGFTAILGTAQGFPFFAKVGDKFSDGYLISVTENQAVFRKTHERGVPLMRPRDIVKEINPEER